MNGYGVYNYCTYLQQEGKVGGEGALRRGRQTESNQRGQRGRQVKETWAFFQLSCTQELLHNKDRAFGASFYQYLGSSNAIYKQTEN